MIKGTAMANFSPTAARAGESHPSDHGCIVSPSCLDCPLVVCKYDVTGWDGESAISRAVQRTVAAGVELGPDLLRFIPKGASKQIALEMLASGAKVYTVADHLGLSSSVVRGWREGRVDSQGIMLV